MAVEGINEKSFYSFLWKIDNFSYCWQRENESLASPPFSIHVPKETKWKLLLFPRGSSDESSIAFYLYRDQKCDGPEEIKVEGSLEFLDEPGTVLCKRAIEHTFSKNSRWGYPSFQKRKLVLITKRTKYLPHNVLTARCSIKLDRTSAENRVEVRNIFALTNFEIERKFLQWTIKEFSSLTADERKSIVIKSASKETLVKIDLYLTGDTEGNINLRVRPSHGSAKFLALETFIWDNVENGKVYAGKLECWCESRYSTFTLKFSKDELLVEDGNIYLLNDALSLRLELTICKGFGFEGIKTIDFGKICFREASGELLENCGRCDAKEETTENSCALVTDLTSLFRDQSLCDMKLKTLAKEFSAHRSILAARSPVFKAMFSTDTEEKLTGCVRVYDLDDRTVQRFLLYMYTDKLEELPWEDYFQLYEAADKYGVTSLGNQCSMLLKAKLSVENACQILILSDMHLDKNLKVFTQDFILDNAKEVFISDDWQHLVDNNCKLALETTLRNWNL